MTRLLSWLLILLLLLAMLSQVLLGWLLNSESGSRWLVQQLATRAPITLILNDTSGTLRRGFRVHKLTITSADGQSASNIQIDNLMLRLSLDSVWQGWLDFPLVSADTVTLILAEQQKNNQPLPANLALPFGIRITQFSVSSLQLRGATNALSNFNGVTLDGSNLAWHQSLDIGSLDLVINQNFLAMKGSVALQAPFPLQLTIDWHGQNKLLQPYSGSDKLAGHGQIQGDSKALHITHQLLQPYRIASSINWQPQTTPAELDSEHHWQTLHLAAATLHPMQPPLSATSGKMTIALTQGKHHLSLHSVLAVDDVSGIIVNAEAAGVADHSIVQLKVHHKKGDAQLTANLQHPPQMPLQSWQLAVDNLAITGLLRDQPLHISGTGELNSSEFGGHSTIQFGDSQLQLQGRSTASHHDWHGNVALTANTTLHPQWQGELSGTAKLYGRRDDPQLDLDIVAHQTRLATGMAERLQISGQGLSRQQLSTLHVEIDQGYYQNQLLADQLRLDIAGSQSTHQLRWQLTRQQLHSNGELSVSFLLPITEWADGWRAGLPLWRGQLRRFALTPPASWLSGPSWQLTSPSSLQISAQQIQLTDSCLASGDSRLCLRSVEEATDSALALTLNDLPLTRLPTLQQSASGITDGLLSGSLMLQQPLGQPWRAQSEGQIRALRWQPLNRSLPSLQGEADWHATLANQIVTLGGTLDVADHGHANASLAVHLSDQQASLSGALALSLPRLDWLTMLLPEINQPSGNVSGRLQLSGSRAKPQFSGAVQLEDGQLQVPAAGVALHQLRLQAMGAAGELQLSGTVNVGDGQARLTGSWKLADGLPGVLSTRIHGSQLPLLNLPEAKVIISPDLQLGYRDQQIRLDGQLRVDRARLAPLALPDQAVRPSADEIIIEQASPSSSSVRWQPHINIRLDLGNDAHFSGFGLNAGLTGNLQLLAAPGQPMRLQGGLNLKDGRYRAYGQNLAIERGVLIFQDRLDDPGLDIRAVRRIPSQQINVGVLIGGTLQRPQPTLFSEPAMEDSAAMAWLLTGQSLDRGANNDTAAVAQALMLYGLDSSSKMTARIGDKIGIDEIRLGTDWESNDAALLLGKQINNRLYLRYSFGLMDALSTVMLRYTLSRRLHLETSTGSSEQSLDLIYQRERHGRQKKADGKSPPAN